MKKFLFFMVVLMAMAAVGSIFAQARPEVELIAPVVNETGDSVSLYWADCILGGGIAWELMTQALIDTTWHSVLPVVCRELTLGLGREMMFTLPIVTEMVANFPIYFKIRGMRGGDSTWTEWSGHQNFTAGFLTPAPQLTIAVENDSIILRWDDIGGEWGNIWTVHFFDSWDCFFPHYPSINHRKVVGCRWGMELTPFKLHAVEFFGVCGGEWPWSVSTRWSNTVELHYGGVITGVTERPGANLPTAYALNQNYPNPFNPATAINYDLPKDGWVSLAVYNVLGQKVRTLVDMNQPAGSYAATWDGRDELGRQLSTGTYIYRLEAGSYVSVRKMVLMK